MSLFKLQEIFDRIVSADQEDGQERSVVDKQANSTCVFPVVDDQELEKLKRLAGDDNNFMHDIVVNFEDDARRDIQALELAVASRDWLAFRDAAHALKGSAMYLGFHQLTKLAIAAQAMNQHAFEINGISQVKGIQQAADRALNVFQDKLKNQQGFQKNLSR